MAEVDKIIERMVARDVERVVLVAGGPMKLQSESGESNGPVLSSAKVDEIIAEIMPANMRAWFQKTGAMRFAHRSPHGSYNVDARRVGGVLHVSISVVTAAMMRKIGAVFCLGGIVMTWVMVDQAHKAGGFFPVLLAAGPLFSFVSLDMAVFGEAFPPSLAQAETHTKVFAGIGVLAGFAVYGLLQSGVI